MHCTPSSPTTARNTATTSPYTHHTPTQNLHNGSPTGDPTRHFTIQKDPANPNLFHTIWDCPRSQVADLDTIFDMNATAKASAENESMPSPDR